MSLYSIVEEYASLGDHRTGTQVDHDTTDWFCDQLEQVGARVETSGFALDIYRAEWRLVIDAEEVPSIPLFYEGVGSVRTSSVSRAVLEVQSYDAVFRDLPGIIEAARKASNEALVISTVCPNNSIYAINRKPELGSGLPVLLVPGRLSGQLADAPIELELDARIEAGQSCNTIGHFGNTNQPPIVVTTPLSGWFRCAGERGTGIAVALSVAQSLAELAPVMLVATSGHELYYEGAWQYIKTVEQSPQLVVHVGASVAASKHPPRDGVVELTSALQLYTNLASDRHHRVGDVVSSLGVTTQAVAQPDDPWSWFGESSCWARFGVPMMSLTGEFPLFHTPEDTTERATTQALLERVDGVFLDAVRAGLG